MVVYKYMLQSGNGVENTLQMAKGAKVLSAQYQPAVGSMVLWVLEDEKLAKLDTRIFYVTGTGAPMKVVEEWTYIGTGQESQGTLIWHVFEDKTEPVAAVSGRVSDASGRPAYDNGPV